MTITEFLLARIAEDEDAAKAAIEDAFITEGEWEVRGPGTDDPNSYYVMTERRCDVTGQDAMMAFSVAEHIARHDPARVLAECAAKRAIVERHPIHVYVGIGGREVPECAVGDGFPCDTLQSLAAVYADHPDYLPEWKL